MTIKMEGLTDLPEIKSELNPDDFHNNVVSSSQPQQQHQQQQQPPQQQQEWGQYTQYPSDQWSSYSPAPVTLDSVSSHGLTTLTSVPSCSAPGPGLTNNNYFQTTAEGQQGLGPVDLSSHRP